MGMTLALLLSMIEQYTYHPNAYLDLQKQLNQELMTMRWSDHHEEYLLSRRQLLTTLASLPSAQLISILQGRFSMGRVEAWLVRSAGSLTASWHLLGQEFALVEEILPTYLPLLETLAQQPSRYQPIAAGLTSQGYRLKGILALHRKQLRTRDRAFQLAIEYARIAHHSGFLTSALISFAYHQPDPAVATTLYQEALVHENDISPLQRSRLYVEIAVACAQQNREQDALRYLGQAQEVYPEKPEDDPSFLYAEFNRSMKLMEEGRTYLALAEHASRSPQSAWEVFEHIRQQQDQLQTTGRIHAEVLNYLARTGVVAKDLDASSRYLSQAILQAKAVGSEKRQAEALHIYREAQALWPRESQIEALHEQFQEVAK